MTALPHEDLGASWRGARAPCSVVHLDAAGCSVPSSAVLDAVTAHLRLEAEIGGYAAETEAAGTIDGARGALGRLVGLPAGAVALAANARLGFAALLWAWSLSAPARVGVVGSEYRGNRDTLDELSRRTGVELVELPAGPDGRLVLEGVEHELGRGLDMVTFPHVASHRGVVQPAVEVAVLCRALGVPLVLDVAQTAGHLDLGGIDAAAWVGTSRKWLRGPRGVGFVAVAEPWAGTLRSPTGGAGVFGLEAGESPVAARVGLATALAGLEQAGVAAVAERIAGLGRLARGRLAAVERWEVQEPLDEATGTVTLVPDAADVFAVARALRARGVLTAAIPATRARDMTAPVLRASFHAYCDEDDVERLVEALQVV